MLLEDKSIRVIHCMGIGGVGVCGVAELLHAHGYSVTGSDIKQSANTDRLQAMGIAITIGHDCKNIEKADAVVYSSAIHSDNPEWQAAQKKGLPVVQRAEMLAELMNLESGIAIAGTHGKTTTTSMAAHVLLTADKQPSFAIGGELKGVNRYAQLGCGDYFVAEADESDASFLHYHPDIAVVTNIDADHMETYQGCFDRLKKTFLDFLGNVPTNGLAVVFHDDEAIQALLPDLGCRVATYGVSPDADLTLLDFRQEGLKSYFTVRERDGAEESYCLNFPGRHNVLNAMAVIIIAKELGVDAATISQALLTFPGVGRRFCVRGELKVQSGEALIIDDYGHHPHEVDVTLQALRQAWPERRAVLVFQPHRYSRTRDLLPEFADVLSYADVLVLLDVHAAGEAPIVGADSAALCQAIEERGRTKPIHVSDVDALLRVLPGVLRPNDVVLMQGAGSIGGMANQLLASA